MDALAASSPDDLVGRRGSVPLMRIETAGPATVIVAGEIDASTCGQLAAALRRPSVELADLAGVTFIDTAGLRTLLGAATDRGTHRPLRFVASSRCVRRLAALLGHDDRFR